MSKKKILFIEDETALVAMMKVRLEASGYEMSSAANGEEGLAKAKQEMPDLVLLDIIMPKMDGLTVCSHLKGDPKTKKIKIIIISAAARKELPKKCNAAGADDLVTKPFDAQELLDKIAKHLGGKK